MSNILEVIYKSVINFKVIVVEIKGQTYFSELDPDFKDFCAKTVLVTNECLQIRSVYDNKRQESVNSIVTEYLDNCDDIRHKDKWIPKSDSKNFFETNKKHFQSLYLILNDTLFKYLLSKCFIFDTIGPNGFNQMTGLSVAEKVWDNPYYVKRDAINSKAIDVLNYKLIKSVERITSGDSAKKDVIGVAVGGQLLARRNGPKKSQNKSFSKYHKQRDDLNWKSMLYSRQSSGRFSKRFILEKTYLEYHQVFADIFPYSLRNSFSDQTKKSFRPLLRHIVIRHKTCHFQNLLKKFCPVDSRLIRDELRIEEALKAHSSPQEVIRYMYSVLHYVIPIALFGTKTNFIAFFENTKFLVNCSLSTNLCATDMKLKIDFTRIQWFSEFVDRPESEPIASALILWLTKYVITVLKTFFYITESTKSKQLFYYRYDLWSKLKGKTIDDLVRNNYITRIDSNYLTNHLPNDSSNLLTFSSYRLVPKTTDFRIINRLISRVGTNEKQMKSLLRLTLTVLKGMRNMFLENSKGVEQTLHQSLVRLKALSSDCKLFFVRADVANCYPSIDHKKMMQIVDRSFERLTVNNSIIIKELDVVTKGTKKLFVRHIHYVATNETKSLPEIAKKYRVKLQNCVIVSKAYKKVYYWQTIKNYIKTYIEKAIVKVNKNSYYRINSGIRQGGMLSAELCALYVESLVDHYFGDLGLLSSEARLVKADDFLFITPSPTRANIVIDKLEKLASFDSYNLGVNLAKLKTNLQKQDLSYDYQVTNELQFFGYLIDIERLNVSVDFGIYCNQVIGFTFNCSRTLSFKRVIAILLRQVSLHMCPILVDCRLNDRQTVVINIFERVLLQSIRLSAYLKVSKWKSEQNIGIVLRFAQNISKLIYNLVQKWKKSNSIEFDMTYSEVNYVAVTALLSQWTVGRVAHRKTERTALKRLRQLIESNLENYHSISHCLRFVPKHCLWSSFQSIKL